MTGREIVRTRSEGGTAAGETDTLYDAGGMITSLVTVDASSAGLFGESYGYDGAGRLQTRTVFGVTTIAYSYDPAGQLLTAGVDTYGYNANGVPNTGGLTPGANNQVSTDGLWTYTYANAGELIEKSQGSGAPTWWYRYDHDSHMTQATYANDGSTVTVVVDYVYDVFGNLIGRTEADGGTVVSVEAFVVDSWDTAKPGAMGNENYDDYADLAPSGSGWAAVAQRLFGPGFNEPVAGITASSAVGWYAADGHLYLCGMFAWAGNQTAPGGFYRVRHTGKPANLPIGLKAQTGGVELTFTDEIDAKAAVDPANYEVKVWGLKRTQNYGSKHIDEKKLAVLKATVDGKTVRLEIVGLAPTWGMEIKYRLKGTDGRAAAGVIHNTVHTLSKPSANFGQEVVDREREGGGKLDVDRVEDAEQVMASSGPIARDAIGNEKCLHKRERVHPRHSTTPGRSKQRGIRFAETRRNRCELSSCQLVRARR